MMNSSISPGHNFKVVNTNRISDQIGQQLLEKIVAGDYKPGDRLPSERDLASMIQVSRIAVREAIGTLAAKGIITVKQGRGATVNPPEEWNTLDPSVIMLMYGKKALSHLMEYRKIVEPELAALAAERIQEDEIAILLNLSELPEEDTVEEHARRDIEFHLYLAKVTRNPVILMVMSSISELTNENRRRAFHVPGELAKARRWHKAIAEAVASHKPLVARQAMLDHLNQVVDALDASIV